ncbi:MAG: MgtC/SapB transporter [Bradyrhizobium sp.]|nr:MgtC/SapB transporter [Bradyrhizobium sp.]
MTTLEVTLRLAVAVLAGGAIGLNRDLHEKQTGVRTLGLVALGSAVGVMAAAQVGGPGDATRAMQGILTGIGFLGAGVIIRAASGSKVHGLTTAASTWLTACIGIACAVAAWEIVVPALVLALVVLIWGGNFEKSVRRRFQGDAALPESLAESPDRGPAAGV